VHGENAGALAALMAPMDGNLEFVMHEFCTGVGQQSGSRVICINGYKMIFFRIAFRSNEIMNSLCC